MISLRFDAFLAEVPDDNWHNDNLHHDDLPEFPAHFGLPEKQLADYDAIREASEVGRIFKIANTIHDRMDAVVVLGNRAALAGPQALFKACCDPYHNELARAERGSRPRMYFLENNFDNDATASLLSRLAHGGYAETPPERRFAIVAIDDAAESREAVDSLPQFLASLPQPWSSFLIPVTRDGSPLSDFAKSIECDEIYSLSPGLNDSQNLFTASCLMPSALLALDCMKLLEGAAAMCEHYRTSKSNENLFVRYQAVNRMHEGKKVSFCFWPHALRGVGEWFQSFARSVATEISIDEKESGLVHHVTSQSWRMDPVSARAYCQDNTQSNARGETLPSETLPQKMQQAVERTIHESTENGNAATNLALPLIDTYTLGQLFQFLMIAHAPGSVASLPDKTSTHVLNHVSD